MTFSSPSGRSLNHSKGSRFSPSRKGHVFAELPGSTSLKDAKNPQQNPIRKSCVSEVVHERFGGPGRAAGTDGWIRG